MGRRWWPLLILALAGCGAPAGTGGGAGGNCAACHRVVPDGRPPAEKVSEARLALARLAVTKAEGDVKDAKEDLERLEASGAVPAKTLVDARRKVEDAEHNVAVAKAQVAEVEALRAYSRETGHLPEPMRKR